MTSSHNRFLWNSNTNLPRAYLSDISNFILIGHKRTEIQSKETKWVLLKKNNIDLWLKVANFNRVQASAVSKYLAKNASKCASIRFEYWSLIDRERHAHKDKLKWKYNPSATLWRCKKILWHDYSRLISPIFLVCRIVF